MDSKTLMCSSDNHASLALITTSWFCIDAHLMQCNNKSGVLMGCWSPPYPQGLGCWSGMSGWCLIPWLRGGTHAMSVNYSTHPGQVTQLMAANPISDCFCSCIYTNMSLIANSAMLTLWCMWSCKNAQCAMQLWFTCSCNTVCACTLCGACVGVYLSLAVDMWNVCV